MRRLFFVCMVMVMMIFEYGVPMGRQQDSLRIQAMIRAANKTQEEAWQVQLVAKVVVAYMQAGVVEDQGEEPLEDQVQLLFKYIGQLAHPLRRPGIFCIIRDLIKEDSRLLTCKNVEGQTPVAYAELLGVSAAILEQLRLLFNHDSTAAAALAADGAAAAGDEFAS